MADSSGRRDERGGEGDSPPVPGRTTSGGDGGIEEASPDSLKNTPSNIARLEDVIEHCTARRKYLAQTRSPSDGGDVRWYFCKVPLADQELAASVPLTEIVGKGDYFRFGMRDSLAVEASFLQGEEEFLFHWWKEYAECSIGPLGRPSSSNNSDKKGTKSSSERIQLAQALSVEEERVGVPVKGGLYEVDLVRRHCFPVYWNGENRRILRGHWFARKGGLDWLPLREDVAEQLEVAYRNQVWHRRRFQPSGLFAARVDLQGSTPGLHALFVGEDDTWEAWLHADPSGFSTVIPLSGSGVKLRRGYSKSDAPKPTQDEIRQRKEEERDDYCSQVPVRHLVFMVHGIGQRLEKSNLVDDVGNFLQITEVLAEQHLTPHQRATQRVLYIPCQWRKGLKLGGESAVEKITLDGVRGLRVMLSATVHDVLYYMSPIYCQDIINSLSNQLNRLYLKFLKRNPGYDGKVSIYGHSLGSVLSYDILCHQEIMTSPFLLDWMYKGHRKDKESSPVVDNQSSSRESSNGTKNENSFGVEEVGGMLTSDQDLKKNAEPSFLTEKEDELEKSCEDDDDQKNSQLSSSAQKEDESQETGEDASVDLNPFSHSGEYAIGAIGPTGSSGMEDIQETVSNSTEENDACDNENENENDTVDETRAHCAVSNGQTVKVTEEAHEDTENAENIIELLQKEIDSLKAKIARLESHDGDGDGKNCQLQKESKKDVCTTGKNSKSAKLSEELDDSSHSYTPYINYTKLEFQVDTFFAVGSPLGVFLSLRNVRIGIGEGQDYWDEENITEEMPACRQMLNIFHPFDPVAYRIEPLVCKEYIGKRPVIIPYHKGGKRLHTEYNELTERLAARTQAIKDHLHSLQFKVLTLCQSTSEDNKDDEEESEHDEEPSYGSLIMERLTGSKEGRIDHVLQDETFRHAYLSAIGSHTNYWRDYDTALFILKHLYRYIPEDPNSCEDSNNDKGSTGWSDRIETIEEEQALTFSKKKGQIRLM